MSAQTNLPTTRISGLFVNLPVTDLPRSRAFFEALGFAFNPQFSDDTAACLVLGEQQYAMLLTHAKFAMFTRLPIADAHRESAHLSRRLPVKLIYHRVFKNPVEAIAFEKKLKGWSRKKKEAYMAGEWNELKRLSRCLNPTRSDRPK